MIFISRLYIENDDRGKLKVNEIDEGYTQNKFDITNLTEREKEILNLLSKGLSNKEISKILKISYNTVKNHLYNIYKKMNVSDRMQAVITANINQS